MTMWASFIGRRGRRLAEMGSGRKPEWVMAAGPASRDACATRAATAGRGCGLESGWGRW
jgi:hypothetical protein